MKMIVAHTFEIDDPVLATEDILAQLSLESNLKRHAAGIVICHADSLKSGAVKALCNKLPFDVVGMTSLAFACNGATGLDMISFVLLTSDEISFSTALTDSLQEEQEKPIAKAYAQALAELSEKPALILTYAPLLTHVGGERLVAYIDDASQGVPLFGTLACDHSYDLHDSHVVYNGEHYKDKLALLLLSGPVKPRFSLISILEKNIQKEKAVITASEGNLLKEINDMSAVQYLASIGLTAEGGLEASVAIPFIVDYNDGTQPVARGLYTITPEGYAVCGGDVPVNAFLSLAVQDRQDVMDSAGRILPDLAEQTARGEGCLLISCVGRSMVLDTEPLAEAEKVKAVLGSGPFHLLYSGGEICPVYTPDGSTVNRFHNFTFTACVFEKRE